MRRAIHRRRSLLAFGALVVANANLSTLFAFNGLRESVLTPLSVLNTRYDLPLYLGVVTNITGTMRVVDFLSVAMTTLFAISMFVAAGYLARNGRGPRVLPFLGLGMAISLWFGSGTLLNGDAVFTGLVQVVTGILGVVILADAFSKAPKEAVPA